MKRLLLFFQLFVFMQAFAGGGDEKIVAITSGGVPHYSGNELGWVQPCSYIDFTVYNVTPPGNFDVISKYEWYVNNVLVKTSSSPTDNSFTWQILSKPATIYAKVTYYDAQTNSLSSAYPTNNFLPNIKQMAISQITASSAPVNFGCTNPITFTVSPYTCSGQFCEAFFTPSQYNVTWQVPNGWSQTNISPNGSSVTFVPDAITGGIVTATITLSCGYAEIRTYNLARVAAPPTFAINPPTIRCSGTQQISITPPCGASSYTYSISGSSGATFTANGVQSLTTSNTTIDLTLQPGGYSFTLSIVANYPGNNNSTPSTWSMQVGVPYTGMQISNYLPYPEPSCYEAFAYYVFKADYSYGAIPSEYEWAYRTPGGPETINNSTSEYAPMIFPSSGTYEIVVRAKNQCGVGSEVVRTITVNDFCWGSGFRQQSSEYVINPNPAASDVTVSKNREKSFANTGDINEVKIFDKDGVLVKKQKVAKTFSVSINVRNLPTGYYVVEIVTDKNSTRMPLIIRR